MKRFATAHPLILVVVVLFGWLVASLLGSLAAGALLGTGLASDLAQSLGTLAATGLLLLLAQRLGWLSCLGLTRPGGRRIWGLTLLLLLYFYVAYRYAFFGPLAADVGTLVRSPDTYNVFARQMVVGFVEETLFRGFLLYALVRVWGTSRRGLLAATTLPALLFGSLHILQLTNGNELPATLLTIVLAACSGIWLGALVLRGGSLWPAVIIHAWSNMVVNIGALAVPDYVPPTEAFVVAALLELPLMLLGAWWLLRRPLPAVPQPPPAPSAALSEAPASS
ncbi:MAG: lysostaphin resistance A-like protein [Anaerolineae bacterium]